MLNKKRKLIYFLIFYLIYFTNILAFELEEIFDGIFVHFGKQEDSNKKNEGDISNIGFIIGSKSIMVVDTGGTPKIGKKLLNSIKKISNLPISHVVITHSHPDHFFGTQVFNNYKPKIIGHEKLNRSLVNNFEFYKSLQFNLTNVDSIKESKLVLANKIVKIGEKIEVDLGERIIEIKAWPSGHTDNDLSIYDKKTKVLWTENIFVDRIPPIRASILGWKLNIELLLNQEISMIIPGHGHPKTKKQAINPMMKYFNRIIKETREYHATNKTLSEAQKNIAKKNIENWLLFENYHISNISKAYTELEWE